MKTYIPTEGVQKEWFVIDAEGKTFGRLASQVAKILIGKHKPTYTPSMDTGDYVIVINTDKLVFTGKKLDQKIYYRHTGYVGGLLEKKYRYLMQNKSDFAFREAVRRMLPKNRIGRKMIKKLHVYTGSEHNNQAQCPKALEF